MTDSTDFEKTIELVNHETRTRILIVLAESHRNSPRAPTLRFSELRRRVGHDDPGNFNYHLSRLTGNLVRKTDIGYELSNLGGQFVALLLSGRFDVEREREFPDANARCLICGDSSEISYRDGVLRVICNEGHTATLDVGPRLIDERAVSETLNLALRRNLYKTMEFIDGVCPDCEGETTVEILNSDVSVDGSGEGQPINRVYLATCERCGQTVQSPGTHVLVHPRVVAFCADHGFDTRHDAWTLASRHIQQANERSRGGVTVELEIDGEVLRVGLNESGQVESI